ncbi:uncharacterized protein LOC116921897 isoform X2 [Daphnia magna]|uniref:thioredoxin-dependent peroxiredoxin n=1 Tax=Daphnia magna TaxID=35525 RepID=A0A0N7ZR52_9CRUS|nr:uncharacterized protein LOC116921897 isoform X2 [Daphnia magna]KAK4011913.1 hypothetical protein OUZ56_021021 [Daphnia magna]
MSSMVDKQEIIDMIRLKSPRLELVSFEAGKSEAWRWFKRVRVDGAVLPYAVCNGCFKPVHYTPRDGTGGLRRHACPLTVAMAQAKSGLTQSKTPSPNSGARKQNRNGSGAATPDNNGTSTSSVASSPRSRNAGGGGGGGGNNPRRSATVPVSLTMWAAEKGLVDLSNSAGLPSGGLSIASAFAALQGIVPRCSPYLTSSSSSANNPQAHQQLLQLPPISEHHPLHQQNHHHHHHHRSNGSPKMADSALDLAMKKSSSPTEELERDDDDDDTTIPSEGRKAQSIVDHILLNISHQAKLEQSVNGGSSSTTIKDANQNEQTSRFSIVPASRSSSGSTRRPRKRSNPDRAIPSNRTFVSNGSSNGGSHHPDIEANLQMLAHVANEPPAVKRERISSPVDHHLVDSYRYQMNGGQLTPTSQHSVPSPAEEDGDHPASTSSSAGSSTSSARKSGTSSPAQFAHHVPAHLTVPSSAAENNNNSTTSLVSYAHPSSPTVLSKPVESFVAAMHQVLQGSPQCSLADAAQLIQLNDLTTCLHSLLDLHKKSLAVSDLKMPVPDLQKPAPVFKGTAVVDGQFKEISLEDYKGKYVILFFYPLDFTFVCPTEIIAFSDRAEEFRKINCELVACSTDSHFCHLAWVNTPRKQGGLGSLNIPLLADKSAAISKSYGVYKEDEGLTFRGLFIIDEEQRLRQVTINDLPVGRSVDETLRLVQAFQFTDKHGEVCPAGWTPGKKSMKADPAGSKEYFEASQ